MFYYTQVVIKVNDSYRSIRSSKLNISCTPSFSLESTQRGMTPISVKQTTCDCSHDILTPELTATFYRRKIVKLKYCQNWNPVSHSVFIYVHFRLSMGPPVIVAN